MDSIIFALLAFFGWGFGDFFATTTSRKINSYSATFWNYVYSSIFLSLFIPFTYKSLESLTLGVFLFNLLLGLIFVVSIICFREALSRGSSPVVVAIVNSYAVITTLLSVAIFQEKLTSLQWICIALVFTGLLFAVLDYEKLLEGKIHFGKGVFLAFITSIFWGIGFALIKIPVKEVGWFWPVYFAFIFFVPVIYLWIKFKRITLHRPNHNQVMPHLLAGVILARLADLSYSAGISKGYTSIVASIAGSNPIFFLILSAIFLKDPVTKHKLIGIIITLTGVILLSFLSV